MTYEKVLSVHAADSFYNFLLVDEKTKLKVFAGSFGITY